MPRLASVSIYVNDLAAAVDFYTTQLGFTVRGTPIPVIIELEHEGAALVLCQARNANRTTYPDDSATIAGFAVDDVDAYLARLKTAGVKVVTEAAQEFPGGRYIAVSDPSGNVIELLQFG